MKRNVMISGEFTLSEMTGSKSNTSAKKGKNAKARIEALKAAGVDTSNYFPMGEEMVVKVVDGVTTQVLDDDPIFQSITKGGYLNHYKLYRRWVMSQMFHILKDMNRKDMSFNAIIQHRGYEYQWRVVENELYAQMKMEKNRDLQSLSGRVRWFNSDSVAMMAEDYIRSLKDYIDGSLTYRTDRKGVRKNSSTPARALLTSVLAVSASSLLMYKRRSLAHYRRLSKPSRTLTLRLGCMSTCSSSTDSESH